MRATSSALAFVALLVDFTTAAPVNSQRWANWGKPSQDDYLVSLGVRPYYLIQNVSVPAKDCFCLATLDV